MKRHTDNNIQKIKIHDYDSGYPRVIRFGSDVFSPLIPPPTCFQSTGSFMTTAINPQDVILNKNIGLSSSPIAKRNNKKQVPLGSALMIGPTGYIETVRSPYVNFNDIFFDASPTNMMFSINCPDNSSTSSICSSTSQAGLPSPSTGFEKSIYEESISLPPSSAILQSELDNSSLDYLIKNNSFIEEIKSSLTVEQQQYINSGVTKLSSTYSCTTTTPSIIKESFDLITPDYSHDFSVYQPDLTAYEDMFENNDDNENSCSSVNTPVGSYSYDDDEIIADVEKDIGVYGDVNYDDDDDDDDDEYLQPLNYSTEESETRLRSLLKKLNDINNNSDSSSVQKTLEQVKTEYISEITNAFIYNHQPSVNNRLAVLCSSVIKAYNNANRIDTGFSAEIGRTNVQEISVTNKKRKTNNTKEDTKRYTKHKITNKSTSCSSQQNSNQGKKSRKNYDSDSINALMDWYLKKNGKVPSSESRRSLAEITGKSDVQISTWFQNARRRHQNKLEKYQYFSSKYPTLVYNFQSFKSYSRMNKH